MGNPDDGNMITFIGKDHLFCSLQIKIIIVDIETIWDI